VVSVGYVASEVVCSIDLNIGDTVGYLRRSFESLKVFEGGIGSLFPS
jgi:hypothetical protein